MESRGLGGPSVRWRAIYVHLSEASSQARCGGAEGAAAQEAPGREGLCQQKATQRQGFTGSHRERCLPMALPREPAQGAESSPGPTPVLAAGLSNQSLASLGRTSCHSPGITPLGSQPAGMWGPGGRTGSPEPPACGRGAWKWVQPQELCARAFAQAQRP